jgi:hypothetical protein
MEGALFYGTNSGTDKSVPVLLFFISRNVYPEYFHIDFIERGFSGDVPVPVPYE